MVLMANGLPYVTTAEINSFVERYRPPLAKLEEFVHSLLPWVPSSEPVAWGGDSSEEYDRKMGYRG
jgi:hypothetical protein